MYIWLPIIMVAVVNGISSDNFAEISFTPVQNTEIGEIELFDTIEVEFDLKLTAVPPGGWVNILQIGEDHNTYGYPSVYLTTNRMRIHYLYNTNVNTFDINLPSNQIDDTFHIYGYFSNSEIKFYFNGLQVFQKSANYFHDLYTGINKIYGSNWVWTAAAVEVTNLCITSYRPDFTKHIAKEDAAVEFDGPLIPTQNTNIGESLAVYNEIEIEFDLTINNPVAAGWHNIFQIGNDHWYVGHPALYIQSGGIMRVHWAANSVVTFDPVTIKDESGKKYHIYLKLNHGLILFEINGVVVYEVKGTAYYFNNNEGNYDIYASNNDWPAADVTITNFRATTKPLAAKKYLNDATSDICDAGPIVPTQNTQLNNYNIDIQDIVEIEFDMELNAVQLAGWRNIIQIGEDHATYGHPGIYIYATKIRVHWAYDAGTFTFDSVINKNEAGEMYHIYGKFSDSEITFVINDIESKSEIGKYYFENYKSSNTPIFASNKDWPPADVTITNLCIKSTDVSTQYIDPSDADFCIDEIEASQNNQIGTIDIDDIIEIEFNMKFNNDIPGGLKNIIQIGDGTGIWGNPSIYIAATILRFHFSLDSSVAYSTDAIIGNKAGNNYHIYAKYTHDSIYININGVTEQNLTNYFNGYSYNNYKGAAKPIYLSNPTYATADVLINNLCIKSYAAAPVSIVRNLECDYTFPVCTSNEALEIIFLMDESGSIDATEWGIIVNFVNRLIEYDVNDNSYVSLFEYSSTANFQQFSDFILSNSNGKQLLFDAMNNNPWLAGGLTYTGNAMIRTIQTFNDYNANNDGNNDRNNVLFLITDGEPTDTVCTTELTSLLSSDIRIVLIGVGSGLNPDTWTNSMDCLVNDDRSNVFYVAQFDSDAFNEIEAQLRQITCVDTTVTIGSNVNLYSNLFWKYLPVLCVVVMVLTTFIVIIKYNVNKSKLYNKVKVIDDYDSDVEQQKIEINQ